MSERKGILGIVGAATALVGVKGCAIITRVAATGADDAARAATHLAPVADDAARGAASVGAHALPETTNVADDAAKAALSVSEHKGNLVDDGGKYLIRKPIKGMSDSERITEATKNYLRHRARSARKDEDEDEPKGRLAK